jgi:uncharacterized coiled-coil protein SlyX
VTYNPGVGDVAGAELDESAVPQAPTTPHQDEWDELRQVLAGDDGPPPSSNDEVDAPELDGTLGLDDGADASDVLARLVARVTELEAVLEEERTERERLSAQLDRLATEFDAVLGEALDEERHRREQVETALRDLQTTLADGSSPWNGGERRSGVDRRSAAERHRGLAPRPLRGRRSSDAAANEPAVTDGPTPDAAAVEANQDDADQPSLWKSRLSDVAGSVSAWSTDDVDRLRVD